MAITSYAELQTALDNWLNRSDLSSRTPEFISLAEAKFNRRIRNPEMLTRDDTFTVASQYETLPTGFLSAERFVLLTNPDVELNYVTPEELSEKKFVLRNTAKPIYYTVIGDSFEFLPEPADTYTASLLYYKRLDGLATTDPNWLLTNHPDIYLYGALCEAEPYMRNDERLPVWKSLLAEALQELEREGQRKKHSSTPTMRVPAIGQYGNHH